MEHPFIYTQRAPTPFIRTQICWSYVIHGRYRPSLCQLVTVVDNGFEDTLRMMELWPQNGEASGREDFACDFPPAKRAHVATCTGLLTYWRLSV